MAYLFGPVPSRRLGRSLGVDLIPPKTCPYHCIYCEVGPTTQHTRDRRDYHADLIMRELEDYLQHPAGEPDFITLAGSGEPTLNLGLGRIIARIKELTDTPVAVLTNGALLYLPEVRRELAAADVVLPSLDAAREETFRAINRPVPELTLAQLLGGLAALRREFSGQIWLEVMLLQGLNDSEVELAALSRAIRELAPDRVQLNTAVRPVVEARARPLTREEMTAIASFLGGPVEVIAAFNGAGAPAPGAGDADLLEMLARRPMTAPDLARALGLPLNLVQKRLEDLCKSGLISHNIYQDQGFYRCQSGIMHSHSRILK
jgi:wyosine [tRNA(Phe)-imidazoG37] synthetase (radical SAM superfamily)